MVQLLGRVRTRRSVALRPSVNALEGRSPAAGLSVGVSLAFGFSGFKADRRGLAPLFEDQVEILALGASLSQGIPFGAPLVSGSGSATSVGSSFGVGTVAVPESIGGEKLGDPQPGSPAPGGTVIAGPGEIAIGSGSMIFVTDETASGDAWALWWDGRSIGHADP